MNINAENIEELIILLIDNELDDHAGAEVRTFVNRNEMYKILLQQYESVKLDPLNDDATFIYPDVQTLLQSEQVAKIIPLVPKQNGNTFKWAAAIACIIAGAGVIALINSKPGNEQHTDIVNNQPAVVTPAIVTVDTSMSIAVTNVGSKKVVGVNLQHQNTGKKNYAPVFKLSDPLPVPEKKQNVPILLATNDVQPIATNPNAVKVNNAKPLMVTISPEVPQPNKGTLENIMHSDNRLLVNDISQQLETLKEKVLNTANDLKETRFVFQIGERTIN